MKDKRTWRRWVTRIELAIGMGMTVLGLLWVTGVALPALFQPMFGGGERHGPAILAAYALGVTGLGAGLAWVTRIFRGPRDEPPPWRYRDR